MDARGLFDADWYIWQRPDIQAAGVDPLAHYMEHGWREGTRPHPLFDPAHYLAQDPGTGGAEPLDHYLSEGWMRGLPPHPLFDPAHYAIQAGDTGMAPLAHYALHGWAQGLSPHPLLDPARSPAPPEGLPVDAVRE